jgi:hypothetical protein
VLADNLRDEGEPVKAETAHAEREERIGFFFHVARLFADRFVERAHHRQDAGRFPDGVDDTIPLPVNRREGHTPCRAFRSSPPKAISTPSRSACWKACSDGAAAEFRDPIASGFTAPRSPSCGIRSGLSQSVVDALARNERPKFEKEDEEAIYDYLTELFENHRISDKSHERAKQLFGVPGIVELTALSGYYGMVAMTLLAHEMPLPEGAKPPLTPRRR